MKPPKKSLRKSTFRKGLRIQVKIGVTMIILTTLILSGYGAYQYRTRQSREQARLKTFAQNVADQLAFNLKDPLWNYNIIQAGHIVDSEMQDMNILAVTVLSSDRQKVIAKGRDSEWNIVEQTEELAAELPPVSAEILYEESESLGTVDVYMSPRFVDAELHKTLLEICAIVLGLDVLLLLLIFLSLQLLLTHPLKRLLAFANAMARGDFQQEIEIRQRDEIGELAESFRAMKKEIARVVKQVQIASSEVALGSQQLRDSSSKISEKGAQQAAATEEVSSSMEEMMANINQNADNAAQTEHIATKASSDAQEGGEAVVKAVEAMKSIAQKISVIEEIANRTHMLSMNASIEASKAQEYGKGFAVVATEVRNLASQTQYAAKDINSLAHNTVELAEKAGEKLIRLVPDIQHTAELVLEISAASQEQRSGASQVNLATQQLDSISQGYAASSEETASTAEELAAQAEHLQRMVEFFQLPEEAVDSDDDGQQDWTPMLESINTVKDDTIREQLLFNLGQVMKSSQTQRMEHSEPSGTAVFGNPNQKRRNEQPTGPVFGENTSVSPFFSQEENDAAADDGKLDEDFERY